MFLEEYLQSIGADIINDENILKNCASDYGYSYGNFGYSRVTGNTLCLKFEDGTVTDKYGCDENGDFAGCWTPFNDEHFLDK